MRFVTKLKKPRKGRVSHKSNELDLLWEFQGETGAIIVTHVTIVTVAREKKNIMSLIEPSEGRFFSFISVFAS